MIDKLKRAGFGTIAIADDTQENIYAAKQLGERLQGINFEFYGEADALIKQIPSRYKELGLILTDRKMETDDAGLDVLEIAWQYLVPAFVCSGGYQHGNQPHVVVVPMLYRTPEGMTKESPDTWYKILEHIADNVTEENETPLIKSLLRARKLGLPAPEFLGRHARTIAKHHLDDVLTEYKTK